jgi:hypothetical protein
VHSKEQPKKTKYTLKEIIEHKKRKTANQSTELQAQNAKLLNVHVSIYNYINFEWFCVYFFLYCYVSEP